MNKKQPERTAKTRRDFIDSFWTLYNEKDIHNITVAELCRKAGYNRSTFYQYYRDVFEVLERLEEELISEWTAMTAAQDQGAKHQILQMLEFYRKYGEYIAVLTGPKGDPAFRFRLQDALRPYAYDMLGFQGEDIRSEIRFDYFFNGILTLLTGWYRHREMISPEEVLSIARDIAQK